MAIVFTAEIVVFVVDEALVSSQRGHHALPSVGGKKDKRAEEESLTKPNLQMRKRCLYAGDKEGGGGNRTAERLV